MVGPSFFLKDNFTKTTILNREYYSTDQMILVVSNATGNASIGDPTIDYSHGPAVALVNRTVRIEASSMDDPTFGPRIIINGPIAERDKRVIIRGVAMPRCGQAAVDNGHCIHFNNNGNLGESLVEGMVASDTNAPFLTISGGSFLKVNENIAYNITGSGIRLETGSEMYNNISRNLMMVVRNGSMQPSGASATGIWISNAMNIVEKNSVSGSQGDGIVYYLQRATMGGG